MSPSPLGNENNDRETAPDVAFLVILIEDILEVSFGKGIRKVEM